MATTKLATLVIRTLAKPISGRIKEQARQHESFRSMCVSLAQFMYRSEVKLRTNILGENIVGHSQGRHIRPLSEAKAIENGANILAEGFLFLVAATLIIGETWRSSRKEGRRREGVEEQLEELKERLTSLEGVLDSISEEGKGLSEKTDELAHIVNNIVQIGLRTRSSDSERSPLTAGEQTTPWVDQDSSSSSMESASVSRPSESTLLSSLPGLNKTFRESPPVGPVDTASSPTIPQQKIFEHHKP